MKKYQFKQGESVEFYLRYYNSFSDSYVDTIITIRFFQETYFLEDELLEFLGDKIFNSVIQKNKKNLEELSNILDYIEQSDDLQYFADYIYLISKIVFVIQNESYALAYDLGSLELNEIVHWKIKKLELFSSFFF